jgi:hypothetical protein
MKCASVGVDIGVDTSSSTTRATEKQQERLNAAAKKARRCETLARKNAGVRRAAITGIQPTQEYGFTAVGMAPTSISKAKSNVARATGLMSSGTCATSVLRWAFRRSRFHVDTADPRVPSPQDKSSRGPKSGAEVAMQRSKE